MNNSEKLIRAKEIISYALIFLLATLIRLYFNFLSPHPNAAFGQDAAEYLRDAQGLSKAFSLSPSFWLESLSTAFGDPSSPKLQAMHDSLSSLKELSTGGPVFPLFILLATVLFGQSLSYENTTGALFAYSLLSAFSCVFIGLTAKHCWDKNTGVVAGVLAALYPGFIINSGRLYSESFAAFLLSVVAFLFCKAMVAGDTTTRQNLLMGFTAASLQVTRSVMAALSLLLIPILALINSHKFKQSASLFVLGMALLFLPWFALQKCVLGKSSFVIDRYSHFNIFIGTNVNTLGFLTFPYPDLTGIDQESFPEIVSDAWRKSPDRFVKLSLDKTPRLFKFPWNDFKTSIGPFDFFSQVLFHQILLCLAAIGVVVGLFIDLDKNARYRLLYARLFLLLLFAFDLIYLPFIAVPRYALCAMPFMVIFAAAAITIAARCLATIAGARSLFRLMFAFTVFLVVERTNFFTFVASLIKNFFVPLLFLEMLARFAATIALAYFTIQLANNLKVNKTASQIAALLCVLLALPSLCLPLRAHGRWYEWKQELNRRAPAFIQSVPLTVSQAQQLIARPGFVAVNVADGSQFGRDFGVAVAGSQLPGPYIPVTSLATGLNNLKTLPNDSVCPEVDYILSDLSNYTDINNLEMRQWYLVPIPPELIKGYLKQWSDGHRFVERMRAQFGGKPNPLQTGLQMPQIRKGQTNFETNVTKTPELKIALTKLNTHPNACYGTFETSDQFRLLPAFDKFSWEKGFFGVENDHGIGDLALDTKIPLSEAAKTFTTSKDYSRFDPEIRILLSPPVITGKTDDSLLAYHQAQLLQTLDVPNAPMVTGSDNVRNVSVDRFAAPDKAAIWLVRCRGYIVQAPGERTYDLSLTTAFATRDKKSLIYPSKWVPNLIHANEEHTSFDFIFPISPSSVPGTLKGISLSMRPHGDDQSVKERRVQSGLAKLKFEIYQLPNNPIAPGHEIL